MEFFDKRLEKEFDRFDAQIGVNDQYAGQDTMGIREVLRAHFAILDYFSETVNGIGIGGIGVKDFNNLHSAMSRQSVGAGGIDKWPSMMEKCATLLFGLVMNHPFHDANKRTAFLVTLFFLIKHGRVPKISQKMFENFTVDVVEGKLAKYSRFNEFGDGKPDPEVRVIADFLKINTRVENHRDFRITFGDLQHILKKHGFDFSTPNKNFINVVKVEFIDGVRHEAKLAQIGCPSMKTQVSAGAMKTVRKAIKMSALDGWDSEAFFRAADPINSLIDTYKEPLKRLADR
jgi:prophage maintenance system killer protein